MNLDFSIVEHSIVEISIVRTRKSQTSGIVELVIIEIGIVVLSNLETGIGEDSSVKIGIVRTRYCQIYHGVVLFRSVQLNRVL